MQSREQTRALIVDFIQALRAGDIDRLEELLDEHCRWQIPQSSPPPFGGRHEGRAHILGLLAESLPGMFKPGIGGVELGEPVIEGSRAVVEAEISGETPAGKHYKNQYVFVIEIRGGRIAEFREYLDTQYANDVFWS